MTFGTPKIGVWDLGPPGVPGPQVKNHCRKGRSTITHASLKYFADTPVNRKYKVSLYTQLFCYYKCVWLQIYIKDILYVTELKYLGVHVSVLDSF